MNEKLIKAEKEGKSIKQLYFNNRLLFEYVPEEKSDGRRRRRLERSVRCCSSRNILKQLGSRVPAFTVEIQTSG